MPTLDDKAILKAMMEGDYRMGLSIKAVPFTQEEKETFGMGQVYDIIMYSLSDTDKTALSVNRFQVSCAKALDGLLEKADKQTHEEPAQGIAMYKNSVTLDEAFSQ